MSNGRGKEKKKMRKKTYELTCGRLFNPFSSLPIYISGPFLSFCLSCSLHLSGLFVSLAGRMSACPTDEFIFVHAFRLHRQEIYARIAVRGELLSVPGDYSYPVVAR